LIPTVALGGPHLAGKSTLFEALVNGQKQAVKGYALYSTGFANVHDQRLIELANIVQPEKTTPCTLKILDPISPSESYDYRRTFASLREADLVAIVLRAFTHAYMQDSDPSLLSQYNNLLQDIIREDLATVEKRISGVEKEVRLGKKDKKAELEVLSLVKAQLDMQLPVRNMQLESNEKAIVNSLFLLTAKPWVVIVNFGETLHADMETDIKELSQLLSEASVQVETVNAKLEKELLELDPIEQAEFRKAYKTFLASDINKLTRFLITACGVTIFYTAGKKEVRAWCVPTGTRAVDAAGEIHSSFSQHFIKAEVCTFEDFLNYGSFEAARENGRCKLEGKDYVIQDGDIVYFRVNA